MIAFNTHTCISQKTANKLNSKCYIIFVPCDWMNTDISSQNGGINKASNNRIFTRIPFEYLKS